MTQVMASKRRPRGARFLAIWETAAALVRTLMRRRMISLLILTPLLLLIALILAVLASSSVLTPFLYPLF